MTHCTPTPLPFASAKRRKIDADFSGGVLTSDTGALLLRQADRQLGLLDALDQALPEPRDPELIAHPQRCLLAQRIFGIACGYEDLNDHQRLRDDPLWQTAVDHPGPDDAPALASPPTLCQLENRVRRADLVRLAAALVECFIASHATPPEELVLDFDATDDPVHGHQENRFFHGYYDGYCFLPLDLLHDRNGAFPPCFLFGDQAAFLWSSIRFTRPATARTRAVCPWRKCRSVCVTAANRRNRPMLCSTTIRRRENALL